MPDQYLMSRIADALDPLPDALTPDDVNPLADKLQAVIAEVIAYVIDAGSERDAVNESDILHDALIRELEDWATELDHPDEQAHHNH